MYSLVFTVFMLGLVMVQSCSDIKIDIYPHPNSLAIQEVQM